MTDIVFGILLLANAWIVFRFFNAIYFKEGPASPVAIFLLFYLFNYPIRASLLYIAAGTELEYTFDSSEYAFHQAEICLALLYSTLFSATLLLTYGLARRHRSTPHTPVYRLHQPSGLSHFAPRLLFACITVFYLLVFYRELLTGGLFGLYENLSDLKRNFLYNLIRLVLYLKWFLIAYAMIFFLRRKSLFSVLNLAALAGGIVLNTILTTSKGDAVVLVLLWTVCVWTVKGRIPKYTLALATIAVVTFAFYSYTARRVDYYGVRGIQQGSLSEQLDARIIKVKNAYRANPDLWKEQSGKILNRFAGIDALILTQRREGIGGEDIYIFGSVVEIANAVPRPIWPGRPHISFNHHVTYSVWHFPPWRFQETPIGRIGESFYVLNWAGLFYAVLYGLLWNWIYQTFMLKSKNDLETVFYIVLLFVFITPDAHLLYNWKRIVVITIAFASVKIARRASHRLKKTMHKLPQYLYKSGEYPNDTT